MNNEILGYRKTGKDTWEPIEQPQKGFLYTAAIMTCVKCNNMIRGMGGGGSQNTYCVPCYEKEQAKDES